MPLTVRKGQAGQHTREGPSRAPHLPSRQGRGDRRRRCGKHSTPATPATATRFTGGRPGEAGCSARGRCHGQCRWRSSGSPRRSSWAGWCRCGRSTHRPCRAGSTGWSSSTSGRTGRGPHRSCCREARGGGSKRVSNGRRQLGTTSQRGTHISKQVGHGEL